MPSRRVRVVIEKWLETDVLRFSRMIDVSLKREKREKARKFGIYWNDNKSERLSFNWVISGPPATARLRRSACRINYSINTTTTVDTVVKRVDKKTAEYRCTDENSDNSDNRDNSDKRQTAGLVQTG